VDLLRNLPLYGGDLSYRIDEIKRAGGTFPSDNRQVMDNRQSGDLAKPRDVP